MTCAQRHTHNARAFTIVELLIAILVIGVLIGILLIGIKAARSFTGSVVDDSGVESLAKGVESFRSEHGFVPPLTREWIGANATGVASYNRDLVQYDNAAQSNAGGSVIRVVSRANAADETRLRTFTNAPTATAALTWDNRFSEVSLTYYLAGVLNLPYSTTTQTVPLDGVVGPGIYKPTRRGTFEVPRRARKEVAADRVQTGQVFGPYIDVESKAVTLQRAANQAGADLDPLGRAQLLLDRNGVAIRYYQWLNGVLVNGRYVVRTVDDLRVPPVIGRKTIRPTGEAIVPPPQQDIEKNSALSTGPDVLNWAIVGAGPNKVFGDELIDVIASALSKPVPSTDYERAILRNEASADNSVKIGRVE